MPRTILTTIFFLLGTVSLYAEGAVEAWMERQDYTKALFSSLFLVIGLIIGVMALIYNYRHHSGKKDSFWVYALKKPLVQLTLGTIGIIAVVTLSFSNPDLSIPENRIRIAKQQGRPYLASSAYQQLIQEDPNNANYHVQYLMTLYQQDDWDPGHGGYKIAFSEVEPKEFYGYMAREQYGGQTNIANLALGVCNY